MNEFILDKNYRKGDSGPYVWIIQEWLRLQDINVVIDGIFGPATDAALRKFQKINKLSDDGVVSSITYNKLIEPLTTALKPISAKNMTLSEMVTACAQQHLQQHPRALGIKNVGPWVRYYTKNNQANERSWSAGFVFSILKQACENMKVDTPVSTSGSCSELANIAKRKDLFLSERALLADKSKLRAGYIFLGREFPGHWTHTGIVIQVEDDVVHTIEGNINDDGGAEGCDVCWRIRNYESKDFIIV